MHMSSETFNKIASMLQADAKAFKARKLEESISFSKTKNASYIMTLDSMGIGTLEPIGDYLVFESKSALGEKFNGARFSSFSECKTAILAFMLGEKKEEVKLAEEVEELEEKVAEETEELEETFKILRKDGKPMLPKEEIATIKEIIKQKKADSLYAGSGGWSQDRREIDQYYKRLDQLTRSLKEDTMEESATEKDIDPKKKIVVKGVKGMKSRPFKKVFRNMAAYDKWADSEAAEDFTIHQVMNEELEELEEATRAADPMAKDFTSRLKILSSLKWDPAKAVYDKPGQVDKEGVTTTVSGSIRGEKVMFYFNHPEVKAGKLITGWIFLGVALGSSLSPNMFNKSGKVIEDKTTVSPPIKRMGAWNALSPQERQANLKELDDAIRKFS